MRSMRLLLLLALGPLAAAAAAQRDAPCRDRETTESIVVINAKDEPGERLVLAGRVVVGEAQEPAYGARVVVYHTDARGYYSEDGMDEGSARLCGVVVADVFGRFRIETIRPAHYATGGPPAHVHFEVTVPGRPMQHFELQFEGDPKLEGRTGPQRWDTIRPVRDDPRGFLRVERDLWVR